MKEPTLRETTMKSENEFQRKDSDVNTALLLHTGRRYDFAETLTYSRNGTAETHRPT